MKLAVFLVVTRIQTFRLVILSNFSGYSHSKGTEEHCLKVSLQAKLIDFSQSQEIDCHLLEYQS